MARDGGPARQLTRGDFDHDGTPAFTVDGKSVLISANRRADADYEPLDSEIYRVDLSDESIHALTDRRGPDYHPVVSPDGKWVAGSSLAEEGGLYPMDGGEPHAISGLLSGEEFVWTSDTHYMYVYQWKQAPVKIYRLNIFSGQRQFVKEITPPELSGNCDIARILFSADGRYYAYSYTRLLSELYLIKGLR